MTDIIKVGMLGIIGALLAIQFKVQKSEYSMYIGFGISILIFGYCVQQVETVMTQFGKIQNFLGNSQSYLSILLKVIGITYICEFSAGMCKDAGFGTVAEQIEILGKLSVMFAGLPILFAVMEQIQSMV